VEATLRDGDRAAGQRYERGGMPLWAVLGAVAALSVSAVAVIASVFLAFAPEGDRLAQALQWAEYAGLAAAAALLAGGLRAATKRPRA
jgi:hypothetical protein